RPRDILPELPQSTEQSILRALSKNPDDRFSSCQEFACELGDIAFEHSRPRIVSTLPEKRIGFYIVHVPEESLLARQLGRVIESHRFSCWYYGRNAIPGISFLQQARDAIERSQAVILLLSRSALRSADFYREIEHAHKIGCPMLPLLIDISREEFEQLAPSWCRIVGPSPKIECLRTESQEQLVERIVASADALGITVDEGIGAAHCDHERLVAGQIW